MHHPCASSHCTFDCMLTGIHTHFRCHGVQGALDGGLDVPHSAKRFVGFDPEKKELDAETLQKYIFGQHVSCYFICAPCPSKSQVTVLSLLASDVHKSQAVDVCPPYASCGDAM